MSRAFPPWAPSIRSQRTAGASRARPCHGRELFVISADGKLTAVPGRRTGDTFEYGSGVPSFQMPVSGGAALSRIRQASTDGQKFLLRTLPSSL